MVKLNSYKIVGLNNMPVKKVNDKQQMPNANKLPESNENSSLTSSYIPSVASSDNQSSLMEDS